MKVLLRTTRFTIEFDGSADVWNGPVRAALGGAHAPTVEDAPEPAREPVEPAPEPRSGPPSLLQAVTRTMHRDERRPEPRPVRTSPPERRPDDTRARATSAATTAPPVDSDALFARLAAQPGRRAEKDTVLASVWCLGGAAAVVHSDAVEEFVETNSPLDGIKIRPHLLKHVSKTKLLATEDEHSFTLTPKGRRYVDANFA